MASKITSADSEDAELDNILKKPNLFRLEHVSVKGVTMPKRFEEMQEGIYNLEVNDEDIWIITLPKTGTTWTQEMIWMIKNDLDYEKGKISLISRFPHLELSAHFDYREMVRKNKDLDPPALLVDSLKYVRNLKGPQCIKTHLPWCLLPKQMQENIKKPKVIYVTRNPKDTCVSYYYHSRYIEGYTGSFEDFCRLFLSGKVCYTPFWNHIFPFWERRNQPNILFLTYEEMTKDLPSVIRKTATYLDKSLNDEQVKVLTEHLSFESMKNNPAVNHDEAIARSKLSDVQGTLMRSGKVGGYKANMSPEIIKKFDDWIEKNLKNTDFRFE